MSPRTFISLERKGVGEHWNLGPLHTYMTVGSMCVEKFLGTHGHTSTERCGSQWGKLP